MACGITLAGLAGLAWLGLAGGVGQSACLGLRPIIYFEARIIGSGLGHEWDLIADVAMSGGCFGGLSGAGEGGGGGAGGLWRGEVRGMRSAG